MALAPEFVEAGLRSYSLCTTCLTLAQVTFNRENERRRKLKLPALTAEEKITVVFKLAGQVRETKRILIESFPDLRKDIEETKPLRDGRTQIRFGASPEAMVKFNRLKDLMAHKNFAGKWEIFFEQLADIALSKFEPRAKRKSRKAPASEKEQMDFAAASGSNRRPHVSVAKREKLNEQSLSRCQWVDEETGRRCCSNAWSAD